MGEKHLHEFGTGCPLVTEGALSDYAIQPRAEQTAGTAYISKPLLTFGGRLAILAASKRAIVNARVIGTVATIGMLAAVDKLLTMTGYYDGPRSGLCTYLGEPYFYESTWEDVPHQDGLTDVGIYDRFVLARADSESIALSMEGWESWKRWESAFKNGPATLESHPALPNDRPRMLELQSRLNEIRIHLNWTTYCRLVEVIYPPPEGAVAGAIWEKLGPLPEELLRQFRANVLKRDAELFAMHSRPRTNI